ASLALITTSMFVFGNAFAAHQVKLQLTNVDNSFQAYAIKNTETENAKRSSVSSYEFTYKLVNGKDGQIQLGSVFNKNYQPINPCQLLVEKSGKNEVSYQVESGRNASPAVGRYECHLVNNSQNPIIDVIYKKNNG
ncbi:MAG: hypothetical protein AAGG80_06685, partial [Pseudomonadota bacterium]